MENHSYPNIIGSSQAAYINTVAKECGSATNYHNITHPSLPNYIAATSGLALSSLPGFLPDCSPAAGCNTSAKSIFGQVKTWKSYEENMPSNCDRINAGNYAVRHNPAAYYTALHNCSSNDVPYSHLATDLAHNQLPQFSFITPNLIDDMHNGTIAQGSKWLASHLPAILNSAEYKNGSTAVFVTWDEGEEGHEVKGEHCSTNTSDVSCHIPTLVISPSTKAGTQAGHPVQPLLPAGHGRAAARPGQAGPGGQRHHDDQGVQPVSQLSHANSGRPRQTAYSSNCMQFAARLTPDIVSAKASNTGHKETAMATDYHAEHVGSLLRQPWLLDARARLPAR